MSIFFAHYIIFKHNTPQKMTVVEEKTIKNYFNTLQHFLKIDENYMYTAFRSLKNEVFSQKHDCE